MCQFKSVSFYSLLSISSPPIRLFCRRVFFPLCVCVCVCVFGVCLYVRMFIITGSSPLGLWHQQHLSLLPCFLACRTLSVTILYHGHSDRSISYNEMRLSLAQAPCSYAWLSPPCLLVYGVTPQLPDMGPRADVFSCPDGNALFFCGLCIRA